MRKTDHYISLYTDGSSMKIGDNKFESSSAYTVYLDGKRYGEGGEYHPNGTISEGEVAAMHLGLYKVKELLEAVQNPVNIFAYSDSIYVTRSLNDWIKKWAKTPLNETWRGSSGIVAYQDFFKEMWSDFINPNSPFKPWLHIYHINSHISKSGIKKARFQFMKDNEIDITPEEFELHVSRNEEVDQIAERIRSMKLTEGYFIGTNYVLSDWIDSVNSTNKNEDGVVVVRS